MAPLSRSGVQTTEIDLHDLEQLFNPMDPTPFSFPVKDLDSEEFRGSWARERPLEASQLAQVNVEVGQEQAEAT